MRKFIFLSGLIGLGLVFSASVWAAETVRITNIGHGYWAGPFYVAQHEKLFAKHGLKLEATSVKGGSLSLQTAMTEQADVAMVTFEHVLKAAAKGKRVVSIFRFIKLPLNNVIVKNSVEGKFYGIESGPVRSYCFLFGVR